MLKIGVDITEIKRFYNKTDVFVKRILSNDELTAFYTIDPNDIDTKARFLARAWCIKEAVFKADNAYIDFRKINLIKKGPLWSFKNFVISISYTSQLIVAFVQEDIYYE
ncbi:4'-phosphopantetheinyl transferase superfamily protein [Mycoplasma nasistruthionis]|uniref:4'-phosphopantetheinyl transferase superfamily protein n=1 Tax=Mycoplasma nasistruthionis TaxID=353852 RepID=A0A5B7XUX0_9MOLU|nr:4'-phosphopantetheinyl transferase superfamily protein [Mycoplasma nasistruthionis]QCZ36666.1 4'-phosphopantetheinyl transferase superfamily protein [Mycoplasma nasistruthionis]